MRFVHAADLHLDAPFQGVSAVDERVSRALAEATYEAFRRVVDLCIDRDAQFLVIAGDAYNSADKSLRAQLAFGREMARLADAGIEVFAVCGNHDPASGWSAGLALPESVHVFSAERVERKEVVRDGEVIAAVYGRSFRVKAETEDFSEGYQRNPADPIAVGVLHANVGGDPDYDPYAPASVEGLRARGMDYWALGHIHKHEVLGRDPWIVYAGSPQGLNPKETGAHGCVVVDVEAGRSIAAEHVDLAPVSWAQATVDVSPASDLDDVRDMLAETCEELRSAALRPVVTRLTIAGRCAAHGDLSREGVLRDLLDDLRAHQMGCEPWLWVDRLDDRSAPALVVDEVRAGADFASELVRVADELESSGLSGILDDIARPVSSTVTGYKPSLGEAEALTKARDLALDLLLEGGAGR